MKEMGIAAERNTLSEKICVGDGSVYRKGVPFELDSFVSSSVSRVCIELHRAVESKIDDFAVGGEEGNAIFCNAVSTELAQFSIGKSNNECLRLILQDSEITCHIIIWLSIIKNQTVANTGSIVEATDDWVEIA